MCYSPVTHECKEKKPLQTKEMDDNDLATVLNTIVTSEEDDNNLSDMQGDAATTEFCLSFTK